MCLGLELNKNFHYPGGFSSSPRRPRARLTHPHDSGKMRDGFVAYVLSIISANRPLIIGLLVGLLSLLLLRPRARPAGGAQSAGAASAARPASVYASKAVSSIGMCISSEGDQRLRRYIRRPCACRSAKESRHSDDLIDLGSEHGL